MISNEKKTSDRQAWLFLVEMAAFVCLVGSAFTGTLLWLLLDKAPEGGKFLWGWRRHQWSDLHLDFSLAFVALAVVHFGQHWRWIRAAAPRQTGRRAGWRGALRAVAAVSVTLAVVFGAFCLLHSGAQRYGEGRGRRRGVVERSALGGGVETRDEQATSSTAESVRGRYRGGRDG